MKKKILQTLLLCFGVGIVSAQTSQISGFADVNATAISDLHTTPGKTIKNHMELGAVDMFMTSQFDKVSFLGEVAFEGGGVDFERLVINYYVKDYFKITVGKFYTPLGYWNNAYNHGVLIQPTINRPEVLGDFIKSIHLKKQIGVQLHGEAITKYNIGYNVAITHGITDIDYVDDADNSKAVTLNLHAEPIENFKVFVSGTKDVVPSGQVSLTKKVLTEDANFQVMNFGIAYMAGQKPFEFIAEYFNFSNDMISQNSTQGYVLYAGYRVKKFVPYISYDAVHFQNTEKYFNINNSDVVTVGLRYMINPLSVIKMEYRHRDLQNTGIENIAQMQFAIGF